MNIIIPERLLYPNALLLGIIFLGFVVLSGWLCRFFLSRKKSRPVIIGGLVIAGIVLCGLMMFSMNPGHDEVEHVHAAWQISRGLLPYTDFFQHHSPVFWVLFAPIFKLSFVTGHILEVVRVLSTGLSLLAFFFVYLTAKTIYQEEKLWIVVLLFFYAHYTSLGFSDFRPDTLANLSNAVTFYILLKYQKAWGDWAAGFFTGVSLSLSPKYAPLILVLPFLKLWHFRKIGPFMRSLLLYGTGLIVGLLPLFLWLSAHHLVKPFYDFVIALNVGLKVGKDYALHGRFFFIITLFAGFGIYRLFRSGSDHLRYCAWFLCGIVFFSSLVYLKPSRYFHEYYQQMYLLTVLTAGSGPLFHLFKEGMSHKKSVLVFLLAGVILWPDIHLAQRFFRKHAFSKGMSSINTLREVAGDDKVVCITPNHPITSRDATFINTGWQYQAYLSKPQCRARMTHLVQEIKTKKPAIILEKPSFFKEDTGLVAYLLRLHILSSEDAEDLTDYLNRNYRLQTLFNQDYWIRNDRYEKCFVKH